MVESLKNLLKRIAESNELTLFFQNLWKYPTYASFFFLHREQLFPLDNSLTMPFLFWSNVKETETASDVLRVIEELDEVRMQRSLFGLQIKELANEMRDFLAFFAIKVFRSNETLKNLVSDKDFSYTKMKKKLGNYEKINLNILDENEDAIPALSTLVETKLKSFVQNFDVFRFLEDMSMASRIPLTLPLAGIPHIETLLENSPMDYNEYQSIIRELYILKLISNFQTLFWCQRCIDSPQIFTTKSRINPDRLKMKCPKCSKPMSVSSIYEVNDLLKDCIVFKDGLLAVALGWLLNQKGVDWDFSVQNKYENDFICELQDGKTMFECKVHLVPRDHRSFEGQLKQDLIALVKHVEALSMESIHLRKAYLVYNYESDPEEVKKVVESPKLKSKIRKFNIEPISFIDIPSILA